MAASPASTDPISPTTADPARIAAEKIVRIFSAVCNMHVNDILPDIREACAAKDAEIERLRNVEEHAGLMRDVIEGLAAGHATQAETVRMSLRLVVKAYDEGAA